MSNIINNFPYTFLILQVFIVVFITVCANWFWKSIYSKLLKRGQQTRTLWDDAFIHAITKPVKLLIWLLGLSFAASIIQQETQTAIFSAVDPLRDLGVIIAVSWFLIRFIKFVEKNFINKPTVATKAVDETTVYAITKLLRASVVITAILVAMQTLGYSISGVLAFGGIGGIAVGFAARDLLANFFGGLMIYLDRPFSVGDWIRSPDQEIEGTVENIGWRLTTIRTFDARPLYLPNSIFTTISVENPSRMTNRRIKETIGIRYEDATKMGAIITDVKTMLQNHEAIDTNKTLIVNFNEFAPSSLDFFIYTFTKTTDWIEFHQIKQDVLLKIITIIESHGADCAFPTSTLHIPETISVQQT